MESTRNIKRQIQSIKNTAKITKAMEMVAASKMRKSQELALIARPYAEAALRLLDNIKQSIDCNSRDYPLAQKREVKKICLIVITSDKGLCGGLNSSVIKEAYKIVAEHPDKEIKIIAIGKKAEKAFRNKKEIVAIFKNPGDTLELRETLPISKLIMEDFIKEEYDSVVAVYTNFVSTLRQDTRVKKLLPVTEKGLKKTIEEIGKDEAGRAENIVDTTEYIFEPSAEKVLKNLLPNIVETQVFHVILESSASEHSARMVAMKNATENAKEMLEDLNLSYNYARQQKITQEMTEISAGVAAQA
jgi:F-type H+-transporting ATPase subunit gamma